MENCRSESVNAKRLGPGCYVVTSQPQDYVWLQIGTIDVSVKHDDEGVVVDLWSRGAHPECLATTALMFAEAAAEHTD